MRPLRLALGAALTWAVSAEVGAQVARPTPLDSATAAAIAPILEQAHARRLPVDLLIAKAREGEVKRMPVGRIEVAVRDLAERMSAVSTALAPGATEQELRAGVDAVRAGVGVETLQEMRRVAPNGSLAVPLGVLTQLVVRGVPVEQASVRIIGMLQGGALPKHFIALDERVRVDVANGRRPDESLDLRMKGILPTLPIPTAATTDALTGSGTKPRRPD